MVCSFVPPYLLQRLADATDRPGLRESTGDPGLRESTGDPGLRESTGDPGLRESTGDPGLRESTGDRCRRTLQHDAQLRSRRAANPPGPTGPQPEAWIVHDAEHTAVLPGLVVRRSGDPATGDPAVEEAAQGTSDSLRLLAEIFGRDSYDGAGATVLVTVHYERDYVNAFWDGTQLVFGDGDGRVFDRFTKPVDVLAHELAHALTQYTANLVYAGQPGALNESVSDVFAACLLQWSQDQTVDQASWLIGEGLFLPGVQARGLRDMAAPGTAYDDPVLGADPQVGSMADYVTTEDDNGGVHLNSGIANRAFHLAAIAIGGRSWLGAGRIWHDALTGTDVGPDTDFAGFAAATVAAAGDHADVVEQAWRTVGVTIGGASAEPDQPPPPQAAGIVSVRRSGGFTGRTQTVEVDLDGDDPRVPAVRQLMSDYDLSPFASPGPAQPDRFVYTVGLPGDPPVRVPEQELTEPLRQLVRLVLDD